MASGAIDQATMLDMNVRPEVITRLQNTLKDSSYKEMLEQAVSFNKRLMDERKLRLPFLDAQTGVAQSDCFLWMKKWERMPGKFDGQIYTYPARRWRKRRRQYLLNENYLRARKEQNAAEGEASGSGLDTSNPGGQNSSLYGGVVPESCNASEPKQTTDKFDSETRDAWYAMEYEDGTEIPDAGEFDDPESDYDDDDFGSKRKKRPKKDAKRRRVEYADSEKPFCCELCGAKYKTRPGLSYHIAHSHAGGAHMLPPLEGEEDSNTIPSHPGTPNTNVTLSSSSAPPTSVLAAALQRSSPLTSGSLYSSNSQDGSNPPTAISCSTTAEEPKEAIPLAPEEGECRGEVRIKSKHPSPSPYCDFCLGDVNENKKTKFKEEMVSCSDCGRSAHPSCLQFTSNMILSAKKYSWQCIECKTCAICGTSDNDDQLLFCDDCDRGYHMYCLSPPLDDPPEGSWSCVLCVNEYHSGPSSDSQMATDKRNFSVPSGSPMHRINKYFVRTWGQ